MDFKKDILDYYKRLKDTIDALNLDEINQVMNVLLDAYEKDKTIYVCGNGGSASTASHIANDFNKGICYDLTKKFNFLCINDNIATMMAIANDDSYDKVFSKQLENKIKSDDILMAISGSGNSKNIIMAVEEAKKAGAKVIGVSGYNGGKLYQMSDYHLHCNINDMQIVEDVHMTFDHMIMKIFVKKLLDKHV